eukprot:217503-Prorocentrum_minimum.AAC.1
MWTSLSLSITLPTQILREGNANLTLDRIASPADTLGRRCSPPPADSRHTCASSPTPSRGYAPPRPPRPGPRWRPAGAPLVANGARSCTVCTTSVGPRRSMIRWSTTIY